MTLQQKITPPLFCLGIAAVAVSALAFVLIGEYGFGLHPCHLCIYQRWPFAVLIVLGLLGYFNRYFTIPVIALSGLTFLTNAGIALYHSGVERKWWAGLEGCSTPDMSGSIEELMKRIQETAVTRCDEIAWQMFGLSMANYNVILCLGGAIVCATYLIKRRPSIRPR